MIRILLTEGIGIKLGTVQCTLCWRDRNLKYHRYDPLDPSPRVEDLLDYLDQRANPIFWG